MLSKNFKISADNILKYSPYFSQKIGYDISCKLSAWNVRTYFLEKISCLWSAEFTQRVSKDEDQSICANVLDSWGHCSDETVIFEVSILTSEDISNV